MGSVRWSGILALAALAVVSCKKDAAPPPPREMDDEPAAVDQGPGGDERGDPVTDPGGPGGAVVVGGRSAGAEGSRGDAAKVLDLLTESFGWLVDAAASGAKRAVGVTGMELDLGMGEESLEVAAAVAGPAFERFRFVVDFERFRTTTLWDLIRGGMMAMAAEEGGQPCVVGMLGRASLLSADVTPGGGAGGDGVVMTLGAGGTADEVIGCVRGMLLEGESLVEVPIGSRTAYTVEPPLPVPTFMVEADGGAWLIGTRREIDEALGSGGSPASTALLDGVGEALGNVMIKVAVVPGDEVASRVSAAGDLPAGAGCLADVLASAKAFGIGVDLSQGLALSIAVEAGSPEQATRANRCFANALVVFRDGLLAELEGSAAEIEDAVGRKPDQLLQLVRFSVQGTFLRVSVDLPEQAVGLLFQSLLMGG